MKVKLNHFSLIFLALLCTTITSFVQASNYYVSTSGNDGTGDGSSGNPWATIQYAVSAATDGDIINISNGTYTLTSTLYLNHQLSLIGQSENGVIIDVSGITSHSWGINVNKSNSSLTNLTLKPNPNNTGGYPIHVSDNSNPRVLISNISITYISISGSYKTAFDFNGVDNVTISYLTATNTTNGNGIQVSACTQVNADHITTNNNAWGSFAIYCYQDDPAGHTIGVNRGSDHVTVDGTTSTFGENNKIYSQDQFGFTNTNISLNGFDFKVQNSVDAGYTWFQIDNPSALAFAAAVSPAGSSVVIQISTGQFWVNPSLTIQAAVNAAPSGSIINVASGSYTEIGQIVISENISIIGADKTATIIKPSGNTGSSGDSRGWILVNTGVSFNLSNITLDGSGKSIYIGILSHGTGIINNNIVKNIGYNPSGPDYQGRGIAVYGENMTISNNTLSNIGRIGIYFYGTGVTAGVVNNNNFTGKGNGNWLDYGVEVEGGANAIITNNTITNCTGVASVDGSTSSGILATTYFAAGTQATITNNTITNNTDGIVVGYDNTDVSTVVAHYNAIMTNSSSGITTTAPIVDAINNWWGSVSGPYNAATNPSGIGNKVSNNVNFSPWWNNDYVGSAPLPELSWPVGNATIYTTAPTLSWYLNSVASGTIVYDIILRDSTTGTLIYNALSVPSDSFNVSLIGTPLSSGNTYAWQVRSHNITTGVYSSYSAFSTFTVDKSQGGAPLAVPSWPIGNGTVYSLTPTLNWYLSSWAAGNLSYNVIITDTADHSVVTGAPITSATTSLVPGTALQGGHTYNWRVETINGALSSGYSNAATFTVDGSQGGAPVPILSWPIGNPTIYSATPALTWYLSSYASGAISYNVLISDTIDHSFVSGGPISSTNSYLDLATTLLPGHTYNWCVETVNGSALSGYSNPATFTVDSSQGGAPQPILSWPVGNATIYTTVPSFSWYLSYGTIGSLNYNIIITDSSTHSPVAGSPKTSATTSFTLDSVNALTPGHTYTWTVNVINGSEASGYSGAGSFTVFNGNAAGLPIPSASSPAGGITVYNDTVQFNWYLNAAPPSGTYSFTIEIKNQALPFDGIAPASNTSDNIVISGISSFNYILNSPLLTSGTAYHWRVQLISGVSSSAWSDANVNGGALFTTNSVSESITMPVIGAPDHAILSSASPSLSWYVPTKPASDQSYSIELSTNKNMLNPTVYTNLSSYTKAVSGLTAGTYYWCVRASNANGKYSNYSKIATFTIKSITAVTNKNNSVPKEFAVSQNYPNPFNPSTVINYALPKSSLVTIKIYNILGQEVKTLINGQRQPGYYTVQWNGDNNSGRTVASGMYIYRVEAGQYVKTMKMMLLK
ncbi:MAG: FlgD immunoglobulin-like domain containing protein [Ignavibacteriaceae bacterium]